MIEAILFDLDGVLVDACEWHYEALNKALKDIVGIEISIEDHLTKYNGLPTKVKLKAMGIPDSEAKKVWRLKQDLTIETIKENAKISKEKIELHSFLKENNIKICCVTNSIRETAELMLKSTGQLEFMDMVITNEDVENNKPSPDCYNLAVKELNINPEKAIIVEDSPKGIQSGVLSTVNCIWKVSNSKDVTLNNYRRFVNENFNTNGG
jgi:beta-phosphoglucomutase